MKVSDILFTDPAKWAAEGTPERLDETARAWPGRGRPFALLSWLAHDVAVNGINRNHPEAGRVEVRSRVPRPIVGRSRIGGPFLFLGLVARGIDGGGWACRAAAVQPILSPDIPMPVDSGYERRALGALRGVAAGLALDAELRHALGGAVRVALEKPLFPFLVRGGPCLPDALLTVTRPGGRDRVPAGADGPLAQGPFEDRDTARYVIEVMGFADAAYERRKEETHARMRRIGRVIRMEGKEFDRPWNDLDTQTRRVARRIGKDLVGRWETAVSDRAGRFRPNPGRRATRPTRACLCSRPDRARKTGTHPMMFLARLRPERDRVRRATSGGRSPRTCPVSARCPARPGSTTA